MSSSAAAAMPADRGALTAQGRRFIDYVGSWGPAICGHAVDEVNDALKAQIDKGTSFGAPCELEVCTWTARAARVRQIRKLTCFAALQNKLAKVVIGRVPSIEMVRFVNSGTEACLSVLRCGPDSWCC